MLPNCGNAPDLGHVNETPFIFLLRKYFALKHLL